MQQPTDRDPSPILIAGPTASGKSALAMALARRLGGVVINADSMQVYREWRILTARPSAADEAAVPHALYGVLPATRSYSVGAWLADVRGALQSARALGQRAIIVGGTGLYFSALTDGLVDAPSAPQPLRHALEAEVEARGLATIAQRLSALDPATAERIDLRNPRRVVRALAVLAHTGRGLSAWWTADHGAPVASRAARLLLAASRDWLNARIDARFEMMLAGGALDEARAVSALNLPPDATALAAHGAPELLAHLRGAMTLSDAMAQAQRNTRRYAKRQRTWFRSRMADWTALPADAPDDALTLALTAIARHDQARCEHQHSDHARRGADDNG